MVVLFSGYSPFAPIVGLIHNFWMLRGETMVMTLARKRDISEGTGGIGYFEQILQLLLVGWLVGWLVGVAWRVVGLASVLCLRRG